MTEISPPGTADSSAMVAKGEEITPVEWSDRNTAL
jgi:hypothetical protein